MNELLRTGQTIRTESGESCQVEKFLGGGGQGEVYLVKWSGAPYALKWYFKQTATAAQREALKELVQSKSPSDAFLWPLSMAYCNNTPGYGYIMRLRPPHFKSLLDLVSGKIDPTFQALVTAGLGLVENFRKLHSGGMCYCDISFGNAFFDPTSGEVLICDNDNVITNRSERAAVYGTPDFMAPEIVLGKAKPSVQTDLHSLAVLLFYLFHIQHPLIGKKVLSIKSWDLPAREKLLGKEPLFIFDPEDKSNEAVDASRDPLKEAGHNGLTYWKIYPQFLRDVFVKAFTAGLKDPNHGRVTESEWRRVLSRLRDSIYYCTHCTEDAVQNFYDPDSANSSNNGLPTCWKCKKETHLPFRIEIEKSVVLLNHQAKLFQHHMDPMKDLDFSLPCAEVIQHPNDKSIWGLRNCSKDKWQVRTGNGTLSDCIPGKSVRLVNGQEILFGKSHGRIMY